MPNDGPPPSVGAQWRPTVRRLPSGRRRWTLRPGSQCRRCPRTSGSAERHGLRCLGLVTDLMRSRVLASVDASSSTIHFQDGLRSTDIGTGPASHAIPSPRNLSCSGVGAGLQLRHKCVRPLRHSGTRRMVRSTSGSPTWWDEMYLPSCVVTPMRVNQRYDRGWRRGVPDPGRGVTARPHPVPVLVGLLPSRRVKR